MNPLFNRLAANAPQQHPYDLSKKKNTSSAGARMTSQDYRAYYGGGGGSNTSAATSSSSTSFGGPSYSSTPLTAYNSGPSTSSAALKSKSGPGTASSLSSSSLGASSKYTHLPKTVTIDPSFKGDAAPIIRDIPSKYLTDPKYKVSVGTAKLPDPMSPSANLILDKTECTKLNYPRGLSGNGCQKLLDNSVITKSRPATIIKDPKSYPAEFHAKGDQTYKMRFVSSTPSSYVSVFTNRPDPVKYPENSVRVVHSVYKKDEKIVEKQSSFFKKGNELAGAHLFYIERVPKGPNHKEPPGGPLNKNCYAPGGSGITSAYGVEAARYQKEKYGASNIVINPDGTKSYVTGSGPCSSHKK